MFNPSGNVNPIRVSFEIKYDDTDYTDLGVNGQIIDEMRMGEQKNYKISKSYDYFNSLESLTIELTSTFGDADLTV